MPGGYRRRYRKTRGRRYRRRKAGWGSTIWKYAKKAAGQVVKYYLNPEYKFIDNTGSAIPFTILPVANLLTGIAQGDTQSDRSGYSVKITKLQLRADATLNPAATVPCQVRVMLVMAQESNGSTPNMGRLFTVSSDIRSPYNPLYSGEYKVLYDKTKTLDTDNPKLKFIWSKKPHTHAKYNGATNAIGVTTTGHYFMIIWSDATVNAPTLNYYHRTRYLDN